jgi:hypothetical protein
MAWSKKQDLEALKISNPDGLESLISVLVIQEGVSRKTALEIINIRNDNERCRLIYPEQPV